MSQSFANEIVRHVLAAREESAMATYAVVDCARDPAIYEALAEPGLEHRCLYSGEVPEVLRRAAPYVVELTDRSAFAQAFSEAWGRSWGLLLRAPVELEAMRRHLKKLQIVKGPAGQRLLFRFYDPRVMRVFLPTCDEAQLAEVFGPIREIHLEDADKSALTFRLERGRLKGARVGRAEERELELGSDGVNR